MFVCGVESVFVVGFGPEGGELGKRDKAAHEKWVDSVKKANLRAEFRFGRWVFVCMYICLFAPQFEPLWSVLPLVHCLFDCCSIQRC